MDLIGYLILVGLVALLGALFTTTPGRGRRSPHPHDRGHGRAHGPPV